MSNITLPMFDSFHEDFSVSARSSSCPPQTGFNAFAFLAFILLTIDTIMNINNNLNNNNNNRNNNNRNNNNNNRYEQMNMNMNSRKKKSFDDDDDDDEDVDALDTVVKMMTEENVSPWDRRVFHHLLDQESRSQDTGLKVMEWWMTSVARSHPACLLVVPCLAAEEVGLLEQDNHWCPHKYSCPLFQ